MEQPNGERHEAEKLPEKKDLQAIDKWSQEANAFLEYHNLPKRVVDITQQQSVKNSKWRNLLFGTSVILFLVFVSFLSWGIYNDKFKFEMVDNSSTVCEAVNIPQCPKCPDVYCGNTNVSVNTPNTIRIIQEVNSS